MPEFRRVMRPNQKFPPKYWAIDIQAELLVSKLRHGKYHWNRARSFRNYQLDAITRAMICIEQQTGFPCYWAPFGYGRPIDLLRLIKHHPQQAIRFQIRGSALDESTAGSACQAAARLLSGVLTTKHCPLEEVER